MSVRALEKGAREVTHRFAVAFQKKDTLANVVAGCNPLGCSCRQAWAATPY